MYVRQSAFEKIMCFICVKLFFGFMAIAFFYLRGSDSQFKQGGNADRWDILFRERSDDDWLNVWHTEYHSRCRAHMVRHLFWACTKDIYRTDGLAVKGVVKDKFVQFNSNVSCAPTYALALPAYHSMFSHKWLKSEEAQALLRTDRSERPTLTNECCSVKGCNWEEYAEYCPSNKRVHHYSYVMN